MAKIIDFQSVLRQPRVRYFITIDEQEEPLYASKELQDGIVTVMITARTPEEADMLRKESKATLRTVMA
ncbi:MAG: hypothetical protein PHE09_08130 [Oscillospiraceae bacterium]|nr:hypothetical protein [Oscillospiraceae bacterium]